MCSLGKITGGIHSIGWTIDDIGPYGVSALYNGILDGYSASTDTTSIIILNIMMNDSRNGTEYRCGVNNGGVLQLESNAITLYVAGEFQFNLLIIMLLR